MRSTKLKLTSSVLTLAFAMSFASCTGAKKDPDMDIKTMHTLYPDAGPGTFERVFESVKRELEK